MQQGERGGGGMIRKFCRERLGAIRERESMKQPSSCRLMSFAVIFSNHLSRTGLHPRYSKEGRPLSAETPPPCLDYCRFAIVMPKPGEEPLSQHTLLCFIHLLS